MGKAMITGPVRETGIAGRPCTPLGARGGGGGQMSATFSNTFVFSLPISLTFSFQVFPCLVVVVAHADSWWLGATPSGVFSVHRHRALICAWAIFTFIFSISIIFFDFFGVCLLFSAGSNSSQTERASRKDNSLNNYLNFINFNPS